MKYTLTIVVGPHEQAAEFVDELLGEIQWRIDDTDIEGVPVTFGCVPPLTEEDT